jgi:hypothetical protein
MYLPRSFLNGPRDLVFCVRYEGRRRPCGPEVPDRPDDARSIGHLFVGNNGRGNDGWVINLLFENYGTTPCLMLLFKS